MFYEDFQLIHFLLLKPQDYLKQKILLNYEVNTGKPNVAVVMRAPAKIKKGRKGQFFKDKLTDSK